MISERPATAQLSPIRSTDNISGLGAFHLGSRTLENSNGSFSPSRPGTASLIPRFVSTDKVVCRFHAILETKRPWEDNSPLGISRIESHLLRHMTILYYVYDDTVEINEVKENNSGMNQGVFLKRIKAKSDNGQPLTLPQFQPGRVINIFGHKFTITDADSFTRDYFKKELNINLPLQSRPVTASNRTMSRSFSPALDSKIKSHVLGSQFATGLGPSECTIFEKDRSYHSHSTQYKPIKAELEKSNRFYKFEGNQLRFVCVEVQQREVPFFPRLELKFAELVASHRLSRDEIDRQQYHGFVASDSTKKFVLNFYMESNYVDLGVLEKQVNSQGEASLLVKKGPLPRDWRSTDYGFCEAGDFRVGKVLDIFGRFFLLIDCDSQTRDYCQKELLINQVPVLLLKEDVVGLVHPIPAMGQGSLPIGSHEDSLGNVFGMSRPAKDLAKMRRNQNKTLRAKAVLYEGTVIDLSRTFLVTFFLEDDTLQIYEEKQRNSGIMSGSFLKRGRYMNDAATFEHRQQVEEDLIRSPPRCGVPSTEQQLALLQPIYISSDEIYLGGILTVNSFVLKIVEMDKMSLNFCESYPNEYPFSDINQILKKLLFVLMKQQLDLRPIFREIDNAQLGFLSQDTFCRILESRNLISSLNDQELLTLIRRFSQKTKVSRTATQSPDGVASPSAAADFFHSSNAKGAHCLALVLSALNNEQFGETRENSSVFYDDLCDYLVHLRETEEERLTINILPSTSAEAWQQFVLWCRMRDVSWRSLFRQASFGSNGNSFGKLPSATVQQLLLKHGVPSSLVTAVSSRLDQDYAVSSTDARQLLEGQESASASPMRKRNQKGNSRSISSPITSPVSAILPTSPFRSPQSRLQSSSSNASPTAQRIADLRRIRDRLSMQMDPQQAHVIPSMGNHSLSLVSEDSAASMFASAQSPISTELKVVDAFRLCDNIFQACWI